MDVRDDLALMGLVIDSQTDLTPQLEFRAQQLCETYGAETGVVTVFSLNYVWPECFFKKVLILQSAGSL